MVSDNYDVRIARLEERVAHIFDDITEARKAREDINQTQEIVRITLAQMEQRFVSIDASISRLSVEIANLDNSLNWAVKLIISTVLTTIILAALGTILSHVFMR